MGTGSGSRPQDHNLEQVLHTQVPILGNIADSGDTLSMAEVDSLTKLLTQTRNSMFRGMIRDQRSDNIRLTMLANIISIIDDLYCTAVRDHESD